MSVFASLLNLKCKDEPTKPPPPLPDPIVSLTAEDASCTEVWLRLSVANATNPIITLTRDTTILDTLILTTSDSTIVDKWLLPSHIYTYTAQILNTPYSSIPIQARTMDTTNHSFSWQTYQLGDGSGGSTLYDVAIINDTLAYAVGRIYRNDTTFNLAKWNGQLWNLQQLLYQGHPPVIKSIFAMKDNDVWFDPWFHWNGQSFQELSIDPVLIGAGINKMWGISGSLYVVGINGFIAHYNGSSWTKMSSGTDIDLTDIYGSPDGSTVWACGWEDSRYGTYLLRYHGTTWQTAYDGTAAQFSVLDKQICGTLTTLFCIDNKKVLIGSTTGIFFAPTSTSGEAQRNTFVDTYFPGFPERLRGNSINDFFIVGYRFFIAHYNGASWQQYTNFQDDKVILRSVAQKGNLVIGVGELYDPIKSKAVIIFGKRSN